MPKACANGRSGALFDAWTANDATDIAALNERLPYENWNFTEDTFAAENFDMDVSCFVYDAVMAQGIAACQAYADSGVDATGAERVAKLQSMEFESGASGTVKFESTGNRDMTTAFYVLDNIVFEGNTQNLTLDRKGSWSDAAGWNISGYTFNNGTKPVDVTESEGRAGWLGIWLAVSLPGREGEHSFESQHDFLCIIRGLGSLAC